PPELVDVADRARLRTLRGAGDRAPVVQLEDTDLDEGLGEASREARIVERIAFQTEAPQLLEQLRVRDELAGIHSALVGQRRIRDAPAFVQWADELLVGDEDVGE